MLSKPQHPWCGLLEMLWTPSQETQALNSLLPGCGRGQGAISVSFLPLTLQGRGETCKWEWHVPPANTCGIARAHKTWTFSLLWLEIPRQNVGYLQFDCKEGGASLCPVSKTTVPSLPLLVWLLLKHLSALSNVTHWKRCVFWQRC